MITSKEIRHWGETDTVERQEAWAALLLEIDARISLAPTQYEGLEQRYSSVSAILEDPHDPLLGDLLVYPQGSFSTRTVTRPPGREDVDVDAIAYVIGGTLLSPMELLDRLFDELESRVRTGGSVSLSKRCVTVQYRDTSLPCHMDVTPAERQPENPSDDGSGRLRVPDRPTRGWSPSNPKDFANWFDKCAAMKLQIQLPDSYRNFVIARGDTEPLPSHEEISAPNGLRVAVRLMKRHRDVYVERTMRQKSKPISVIITTLAAKAYERVVRRSRGQIFSPLDTLVAIAEEMSKCFDASTENEPYRLLNPRDPDENFAEKWNSNPALHSTFTAWQKDLTQTLRYGLINFPSRERFRTELSEIFGTSVGTACDDFFATIADGVYPGLSAAAAQQARVAGRSAALIGLGRSEPVRPAEPEPLDRLG